MLWLSDGLTDLGGNMFTEQQAEMAKEKEFAGEKFRPSNGMEGEFFMSEFCFKCGKEKQCKIIGDTMLYEVDDENYPNQWQYGEDGQPTCTEFEAVNAEANTRA